MASERTPAGDNASTGVRSKPVIVDKYLYRMSVNSLFGNKKRNSSILYGVDQAQIMASSSVYRESTSRGCIGNHGDGFPPNKRYKSFESKSKQTEDPFGDNDDFTADDLEEIDIIASQALSQVLDSNTHSRTTHIQKPEQNARPSLTPNNTNQKSLNIEQWSVASSAEKNMKDQFGNGTEDIRIKDTFGFEVLQTQHEEVKQKLKEIQDEILIKNGEIKILRDSMLQMECTLEEQRKSYMLLEKEKDQTLSEKEKEFSKKLQSLQSELQFKDAEMNELRAKLQSCERTKPVTPSVTNASPKKSPSRTVKLEGCSLQTGKRSFPTKETFSADMCLKVSCSTANLPAETSLNKEDSKTPCPETELVKQEVMERNVSYSFVQRQNTQGSVLLNALMKQPIAPGSLLGLCHLLSSNSEVLPGSVLQPNVFNTGSTGISSIRTTYSQDGTPPSLAALREAQKLAITGLNLIAMDEGSSKGDLAESERGLFLLKRFKIPGAVHLLPLVEYHISAYCQALQLSAKSRNSPENQSVSSSRTNSSIISNTEDFRSTLQENTVASLSVLYYLVYYSWDVVYILLSSEVKRVSEMEKNMVCNNQSDDKKENSRPQGRTVELQDAANNDQSQHSLFKKLLQLLALSSTATGSQTDSIMNQSLKVLVKLAENSTVELLISFWHLLTSQMLLRCVCPETPLSAVHLTVRLMAMLIHHKKLATQLCCHSETCLLLALYMYITSRPDKSASEMLWLQLEQETVRFLTKCVRCSSPSILLLGTDCQCSLEVVKALIIMLHRQWVKVRRSESNLSAYRERIVQFLRDTVLLLHSLSQKDKLFHEHCLEVLHQYDEAMPGVRAILKKTPNLKASEELALDELYPPEPEVDDQEMDCS
ncbi:ATR-interacting protein isoform X2 [Dermochelys coriacea]|uniref:ATR-interacting protein isoform X2 n=1 Tax=Dermochelys coriacea TaxID=27794 RepID=UPI0018E89D2B|nr:ATR-interacting protein isoform X2 [Dermochelys coriacea]